MNSLRPKRLNCVLVCLCGLVTAASSRAQNPASPAPQQQSQSQQNQQNRAQQNQAQQPNQQPANPGQRPPAQNPQNPPAAQPPSPFENVPQAAPNPQQPNPQQPNTQPPQFETPGQPAQRPSAIQGQVASNVIEAIDFRGARRVPQDTLRSMIFSKVGDVYNPETLRRDFMALWNTNRFDDIKLQTERGERGGIVVTFVVTERPVVRDIKYEGLKSASTSDVLDRFKERKVGLVVESMYDPNVIN